MYSLLFATAASTCGTTFETNTDYFGGDIVPLGAGFRNATSVGDCCRQCDALSSCRYYSYAPKPAGGSHNCWLKSRRSNPTHTSGRTSGSVVAPGIVPPCANKSIATHTSGRTSGSVVAPGIVPPCANKSIATHPWCDATLTPLARAKAVISLMTVAEKAAQLATWTPGIAPGIPRLDWPAYGYHSEGLHGLRNSMDAASLPATIFPQTTAMAATGNLSKIHEMGRVMALEARAVNAEMLRIKPDPIAKGGSLFFWSPTMNLGRDPRWGRFQESIAEDPWLLGAYSSTFLQAFQSVDSAGFPATIASCKHLIAYSYEGGAGNFSRHNFNAVVSAQDLSESYLPAFHTCVTQGKPGQVMCSYNALNGVPTCARADLLVDTLRTMWKFDGFVISDQGAVADISNPFPKGHHYARNASGGVVDALNAGCDVNDGTLYAQHVAAAVAKGAVTEERVDGALARFLAQRFKAGSFDAPTTVPWARTPPSACNSAASRAVALDAARESIVLLNNSAPDASLRLPWDAAREPARGGIASVAVIGALANASLAGGKPDYETRRYSTLLEGIVSRFPAATVSFTRGYTPGGKPPAQGAAYDAAQASRVVAAVAASDATVLVVGIGSDGSPWGEKEGHDRTQIGLPPNQLALVKAAVAASDAASKRLAVVFVNGGPLSCDWCRANVATVVEAFEGGEFAGDALADVLVGAISPSGVLPFTLLPEGYTEAVELSDMSMRTTTGVGRTYRFYNDSTPLGPVLWPFGYGLSYSTFVIKWSGAAAAARRTTLCLDCVGEAGSSTNTFAQTATVTNTGSIAAAKVVMAFVAEVTPRALLHRDVEPQEKRRARGGEYGSAPNKSLFGMLKVFLQPGETKTVTFAAPLIPAYDQWCAFCTVSIRGTRVVAPGVYRVTVGGDGSLNPNDSALEVELTAKGGPIAAPLHALKL